MDSQDALRPDPTATPAATPEATPEEIRESYLRGLVTEGASGPRRTVSRRKAKGKSKPKKTSGRHSAASMPAEEEAAEELLAEIEHERKQCATGEEGLAVLAAEHSRGHERHSFGRLLFPARRRVRV